MTISRIQQLLTLCIKIFVGGLLIHFVLQTFVTHQLGRNRQRLQPVRLRKELLLVVMIGLIGYHYRQQQGSRLTIATSYKTYLCQGRRLPSISLSPGGYTQWIQRRTIWIMICIGCYIMFSSIVALFVVGSSPIALLASYKYNLTGFIILVIGIAVGNILTYHQTKQLTIRAASLMKRVLIGALCWYIVIGIEPKTLEYLGYSTKTCEGSLTQAPPAVYRTELCFGINRNQFVFERPTSFGFWIVARRPVFFVVLLWRRKLDDTMHRWILGAIVMISTFSRASRGARGAQIIILGRLIRRTQIQRFALYAGIPLLIIIGGLSYQYHDQIIGRYYSNVGHINETLKAINKVGLHPWEGRGPGIAGPASHQLGSLGIKPYNPENQFLQILIEHGIIGGIRWIFIICALCIVGGLPYVRQTLRHRSAHSRKAQRSLPETSVRLLGYSIGIGGLMICGLVLHSRGDKMIIYPLMMMMGLALGASLSIRPSLTQ